ncbi:hypothetical protein ACVIHC_004606 [Bradyrhizobium diazoefficiens]
MANVANATSEYVPSDSELDAETGGDGLTHLVARSPALPLLELDDRHFEILAYLILSEKAGGSTFYDAVSLLRTGADKGRDVLLRRGVVTGVVQCKRKADKIGRESLMIEILRFALYAVREPTLAPAAGTRYEIWSASGLTERAREFVEAPDTASLMRAELPALAGRARGNIVSLQPHAEEALNVSELTYAIDIAAGLVLQHVGPEAIASDLARFPHVRRQFFRSPDDGPARASVRDIDELVAKLRREQLEDLAASGRYRPDNYVVRDALERTFADFLLDSRRLFVAVGGSGQGKTSWSARLLASPPDGRATLLIPAEQIVTTDRNPVDTIARLVTARPLGNVPQAEIDQSIWAWLDAGNRLLVVDGLDRVRANVREVLPIWLGSAIDMTRKVSVRLVLTARQEAWTLVHSQLPGFFEKLFRPKNANDEALSSHLLGDLGSEAAEEVYRAYGVSAAQHRGARLRSPSLIALFASLRAKVPAVVTRLSILQAQQLEIERELRSAGIGAIVANKVLSWLGDQLRTSTDGWIAATDELIFADPLEILVAADRLILQNGSLRLDSDDLAELLLARRLTLEAITRGLNEDRTDPIFMGAVSLAIAMSESDGGADAALGALLDGAPPGRSGRLEAAAEAILELQSPDLIVHRIRQAVKLWNEPNNLLFVSNLGTMINEVALPGRTRFEFVMPLVNGEDEDDWRDKYWRGDMPGRWITSFTTAIERSVSEAPESMLSEIVELSGSEDKTKSGVGRTLLYRAAELSPEPALNAAWSGQQKSPYAFNVTSIAAPASAARFLATIELDSPAVANFVVRQLWVVAHREPAVEHRREHVEAVRDASDMMLSHISDPSLRAALLIVRLEAERSRQLLDELRALWSDIPDEFYWSALRVLESDEASERLVDLMQGKEPGRAVEEIISAAQMQTTNIVNPAILAGPLLHYAKLSPQHSRAAARAVEGMLYTQPDPASPELEALAASLAASEDDETRVKLIYYAGSLIHRKVTSGEIARRERLLEILIQHETGENVGTLVWKLIESAPERPEPQRHLNELVRRFGRDIVRGSIPMFRHLPGAGLLDLDFKV